MDQKEKKRERDESSPFKKHMCLTFWGLGREFSGTRCQGFGNLGPGFWVLGLIFGGQKKTPQQTFFNPFRQYPQRFINGGQFANHRWEMKILAICATVKWKKKRSLNGDISHLNSNVSSFRMEPENGKTG